MPNHCPTWAGKTPATPATDQYAQQHMASQKQQDIRHIFIRPCFPGKKINRQPHRGIANPAECCQFIELVSIETKKARQTTLTTATPGLPPERPTHKEVPRHNKRYIHLERRLPKRGVTVTPLVKADKNICTHVLYSQGGVEFPTGGISVQNGGARERLPHIGRVKQIR